MNVIDDRGDVHHVFALWVGKDSLTFVVHYYLYHVASYENNYQATAAVKVSSPYNFLILLLFERFI